MDSKEILQQYIVGAMESKSAIAELEKNLVDTSTLLKMQEAARSRYVIGFIRRAIQFKREEASEKDLCLNIRDLVLFLGRVKLTEKLYKVVREYGAEFDLVCENDLQVSCLHHIPAWLEPHQYIKDVYTLRSDDSVELDCESSGDGILEKHTGFHAYKSFEQKVAVHTALNLPHGHTLLISLPTGGGKSLVTQLLASTSSGLTLVIVPTVALALDQYYAAQHILTDETEIYCYRGEQSDVERTTILKALKEKTARILFSSPEAILKNQELHRILDDDLVADKIVAVITDHWVDIILSPYSRRLERPEITVCIIRGIERNIYVIIIDQQHIWRICHMPVDIDIAGKIQPFGQLVSIIRTYIYPSVSSFFQSTLLVIIRYAGII